MEVAQFKIVKLKNGFFGIAKIIDSKIVNIRHSNWNKGMATYELGFYQDGTLNMTNDDLHAKNWGN